MTNENAAAEVRSFLLRMWRQEGGVWRFLLEDPATRTRRGFQSLGLMLDFLLGLMKASGAGEEDQKPQAGQ